ncbi:hypothetical protein OROGR_029914 [Orobanche gracilis]
MTSLVDPSVGRDESSDSRLLRDKFDGLCITEEEPLSLCDVCGKDDHMPNACPYIRRPVPDGATVGKLWKLCCWHCYSKKIDPIRNICCKCGDTRKRAQPIMCAICGERGHEHKACQYRGQMPPGHIGFYRPHCATQAS